MIKPLVIAATIAALGTAASAGPYVSLGFGKASVSDNARDDLSTDALSSHVALGFRLLYFSVEGAYTSYSLVQDGTADYEPFASRSLGLAVKAALPIGSHLELYGRAGVLQTWLASDGTRLAMSGHGHSFGGGLSYGISLGVAGAALFVDYTRSQVALEPDLSSDQAGQAVIDQPAMDQTASLVTVGLTVSLL